MGQPESSVAEDSSGVGELRAASPESIEVSKPELQDPQDSLPAVNPETTTPGSEAAKIISPPGSPPALEWQRQRIQQD